MTRPRTELWRFAREKAPGLGEAMHALVAELYPIPRSLTGDGVRRTLRRIGAEIDLSLHEVPSGTPVLDWTVPDEWNVREAWIKGPSGKTVVDVAASSLHLMGYSVPVHARMTRAELDLHLHSIEEHPDWTPYRTSYYRRDWGFCLPHRVRAALPEGEYEVRIDATLGPGALTYGECFLPGETADEVLVSSHVCHPALCNDNLSGIAVATFLARAVAALPSRRHSYRFVFAPGTIGAITWLARNEEAVRRIRHGLVVACAGDPGAFHYKRSRRGDAEIDRTVAALLARTEGAHQVLPFAPFGYDERQYCSPGYDLPVGSLTRTPHGRYPEYHTSADDLALVTPAALAGSLALYARVAAALEENRRYQNLSPRGEPQLGRRGLYRAAGGRVESPAIEQALLWVLNLSDGSRSVLDIVERSGLDFEVVAEAAGLLESNGLLRELMPPPCGDGEDA